MRLGVLDVGSDTVHLMIVEAHRGGHPTPRPSQESAWEMVGHVDADGALTEQGRESLLETVGESALAAARLGCEELLAFASSAVQDVTNFAEVLRSVRSLTGVQLQVLTGIEHARLAFLAARRWYGWSAGNLLMLDIRHGSLEIAAGPGEQPAVALSLPLGAGSLGRPPAIGVPPAAGELAALQNMVSGKLSGVKHTVMAAGPFDLVASTSKTFMTLAGRTGLTAPTGAAGPTGAAASSARSPASRTLTAAGLRRLAAVLQPMAVCDIAALAGVSPVMAPQLVAGVAIAEATLTALGVEQLMICPWAVHEGIVLRHLDRLAVA